MKIIENTFKDPYEIRRTALSYEYASSVSLRWPGYRFDTPKSLKEFYTSLISNFIKEKVTIQNSYFQYSDKSWISGSCHHDFGSKYTCITFLNPNNPPESGTEVYGDEYCCSQTGVLIDKFDPLKTKYYSSNKNILQKILFEKQLKKFNSNFKNPCIVSNKFNRTVIFDSYKIHRAQNFFGDKVSNSRLTLISFFT